MLLSTDRGEKDSTSRAGSGGGGKRTVKSAEQSDISRRRQTDTDVPRHADEHRASTSQSSSEARQRSNETIDDDESRYYTRHVAPVLDEMMSYVNSESARCKRLFSVVYSQLVLEANLTLFLTLSPNPNPYSNACPFLTLTLTLTITSKP